MLLDSRPDPKQAVLPCRVSPSLHTGQTAEPQGAVLLKLGLSLVLSQGAVGTVKSARPLGNPARYGPEQSVLHLFPRPPSFEMNN